MFSSPENRGVEAFKDHLWVTESTAASITGLSVHTLRAHRLYRKGIPYSKVGRSVRYSWADVVSFMESRRVALENAQGATNAGCKRSTSEKMENKARYKKDCQYEN